MRTTQRQFDLSSLVISQEQLAPRSEGAHVSAIVRKLSRAMGKRDGDFTEQDLDKFAIVGRLWERLLADALFRPPRYSRPGEIPCDDIVGSPDCVDTDNWSVLEFKACWKSLRDFEGTQKWWEYMAQVKAYCHMMGMLRARLIVLFIAGDWRPPVPQCLEWDITFTAQELEEWWRVMRANI